MENQNQPRVIYAENLKQGDIIAIKETLTPVDRVIAIPHSVSVEIVFTSGFKHICPKRTEFILQGHVASVQAGDVVQVVDKKHGYFMCLAIIESTDQDTYIAYIPRPGFFQSGTLHIELKPGSFVRIGVAAIPLDE